MSASKKKRIGSRRSLNLNVQETHEEGGTANSPPLPQGRPRSDANAGLTLSPDSAQSEIPGRKKKLGSQRGNTGKQPFKEFTIESSHKPTEEVEDTTTYSPAPVSEETDILSFKSESLDNSLEGNAIHEASEMVGFQISDESLNADISTETTESKSQKSDIKGTGVDSTSDGPSEKYLPEIDRAQEGVLSEKDQAKQMPEILQATFPAGVTEETTCIVKLIEQEEISNIGSHDNNKNNTEYEVGHNLEKPVWQESEKSSLPIASIRKLGSCHKKERRHEDLQDQHDETAVETNAFNVLETTGFTKVQNSSKEVSVDFNDLATGVTYKEEGQLEVHSSPKMGLDQINKDDNLSEVVKTNLFGQEDQEEEAKLSDEHPGDLQNERPIEAENLFSVQIPHTDNTNAPVASPHPDVTVSVEDVTATGSNLIGNRRKLGSSRRTKDRRQLNDESKQDKTSGDIITPKQTTETIKTEFMMEEQSPETALYNDIFDEKAARQEVAESFIKQVHDETLETAEDTIATDKSPNMSETTALFMDVVQEQTVKSDISEIDKDIFDKWVTESNTTEMSFHHPDTDHFGRLEDTRLASQESSTKPTEVDSVNQSEISTSPKEQVHQITLSDYEINEEIDNLLTTDQTHYDQVEETKIFESDFVNLTHKGEKSSVLQVHNESLLESDKTVEDITTDKSLKNIGIGITPSSTAVVQEPAVKSNRSPNEDIVNFDYAYFAADTEHKERNEEDLKEDKSLDGSHLVNETLQLEGQLEKSLITQVISSKMEPVTELSEPMFDVLTEIQPSREEHLDQSEDYNLLNFTIAPPSEGAINKNEVVAQTQDVHQITSSSESVLHKDRDSSSVESTEQEDPYDKPHESANEVSIIGDITKDQDQKEEVKLSDDQPVDLQKEQPFEAGEDLSSVQIPHTDHTNADLVSPQPDVTATDSQLIGNRKKLGSSRRTKGRRQVTDESMQDKKSEEITPDTNIEEKQIQLVFVEQSLETEFEEQAAGQEKGAESFIQSHNETMEKVEVTFTTDKSSNTSEITALLKKVVQEQPSMQDDNTSKKVDSDIAESAGDQSQTTEMPHQPPDNVIFERPAEDTTLRQKSSTEKSVFVEQGEPESITQSEIYLSPKQQINVHQIFFLSDNEDMDSFLKPADDTNNETDFHQSDIKKSKEQLVHEEAVGEPADTVQPLVIEVNEPNTDPHHSPMRRKMGSSQRSKGSKEEVTTTVNESPSSTESKDFLQLNPAEEIPQQELCSLDVTIAGQTELSKQEVTVKVKDTEDTTMKENSSLEKQDLQVLSSSPKEEIDWNQIKAYDLPEADKTNISGLEETKTKDFENETRNRDVFSLTSPGEVYKDEDQEEEVKLKDKQPASLQKEEPSELSSEQIPHIDDTEAPNPDVMVNVEEDVTATGSQLIGNRRKLGSSRRTKERRQVNDGSKQWEIDNTPDDVIQIKPVLVEQSPETAADSDIFHGKAVGQEVDESSIQPVQDVSAESDKSKTTTDKSLKTTEITTLVKEVVPDQNEDGDTDDNDLSNITETSKQQPDNTTLETSAVDTTMKQESSTEARDFTEQSEVESETYLSLKEPINVHQLTFLSDNESHEDMDNWPLQQTEQPGHKETIREPSETEQLLHKEQNEPDAAPHHSTSRRKLGSSRRTKGRKQEVTATDNEDIFSTEDKDIGKVTELMISAEEMPQQELQSCDIEQENNVKPEDIEGPKPQENSTDIKIQVVSSEDKPLMEVIQTESTVMEVDSFTIKDLKEKGNAGAEDSPRGADIGTDNTRAQNESTAESKEIVRAELFDSSQTVVMSAEDVAKDQQAVQDMEVLETGAELQINPETKRRKMGSTRRSQLNRKQQDEERNAEDNAAISEKTTVEDEIQVIVTEGKETKPLCSDIFVKQEVIISASPVTDEQQSEESKDGPEFAQKGEKGEVLQTEEVALVVEMAAGTTTQNVHPDTGEEIQPSSPGKRRKMGSTRKNLRSKRESPQADQEEIVTAVNVENEATVNVSNENVEHKEYSGLIVHTATVHQQPDEETPLSQLNNQEKLNSESVAKEAEMFSKPDAMTEEAIVARRRKLGSHRKPHTDQSTPPAEESSKLSEVNVRDSRDVSAPSPLSVKVEPKPVSERPSQHQPLPSTNVRLAQESPIRLSSGVGNKASLNASKYEVVMIGDSSVGKTSFMKRVQSGKFSSDIPASVGVDSYMWTVVDGGKTVVLHLWDTAGQERFHSMTKQIFHRAQAFLLMYDVSCSQSFTAVSYWANCIKEEASDNVVILLLGNKSDCTDRKVQRDDGEILAQEKNFAFMECSAATGENVVEALETVARLLSDKAAREEPLVLRKPEQKNKFGCC